MNGAAALIKTLENCGVELCLANPGTSELHFVEALGHAERMRSVLCTHEGVVAGAADGYARMTGRPAMTLLHLGPGLANACSMLHNARRSGVPMINVVGDHPDQHFVSDSPLASDIASLARPVSRWVRRARTSFDLCDDVIDAVVEACTPQPCSLGQIATLIVPADCASGLANAAPAPELEQRQTASELNDAIAALRSGERCILYIGGQGLNSHGRLQAHRIAAATGAEPWTYFSTTRRDQGAGEYPIHDLPYLPELALEALEGARYMICAGLYPPTATFKYDGTPTVLVPQGCEVLRIADRHHDIAGTLEALADALDAPAEPKGKSELVDKGLPSGAIGGESFAGLMTAKIPEGAIICDDGVTGAFFLKERLKGAAAHSYLGWTGGAIGAGLNNAVGVALACPDRPVYAVQADGGAMMSLPALWSQVNLEQNITNLILSNKRYAILELEYFRIIGEAPPPTASELFDLSQPGVDWQQLGASMGLHTQRAESCEELAAALDRAQGLEGPKLIEVCF